MNIIDITFTNEPGIFISSADDLSEVAPLIGGLYTLGARTISFEDGIEIEAKDANDIVLASENITFANGAITSADNVSDSDLKSVLTSLKNKGLGVGTYGGVHGGIRRVESDVRVENSKIQRPEAKSFTREHTECSRICFRRVPGNS